MRPVAIFFAALTLAVALRAGAGEPVTIAMEDKGLSTFYVPVSIAGVGTSDYLLDTGASYMTIGTGMLEQLKAAGTAHYVRDLVGRMADGRKRRVPVYQLARIEIGGGCVLENVEAAVLPGARRHLLGLSALRGAAPLRINLDPPRLELAGCSPSVGIEARTARLD